MKAASSLLLCALAASAAVVAPLARLSALRTSAGQPLESLVPEIGAASNFSQGSDAAAAAAVGTLPVRRLRDGMRWGEVERSPGRYSFDKPITTWPDRFAGAGTRITLTLSGGNPLYDQGQTPHTPAALAAFGRFAAAVVQRFPAIDTLELGNEFNSANFVNGPVKDDGLEARGRYHLAMVRAVAEAVRAVRPEVRIIGGSAHSLPAGYLWPLFDLPGAGVIRGLAVHPYTTPIDQLPAQVGYLRRHGAIARLPLHVTEFGSQDPERAADDLVRRFAMLAVLGTAEADWYPLNERGDGLVPLVRRDGALTGAGEAFRFVQARLAGQVARDASPDAFTTMHTFGPNVAVLWGAPRGLAIDAAQVTAYDARGRRLDPAALSLAEDRALVLVGAAPLVGSGLLRLDCLPLVADSFLQFGYPQTEGGQAAGDGFARFITTRTGTLPFEALPGQQRQGVPWPPYLGRADRADLRLTADTLLPANGPGGALVHRFVAPRAMHARLAATFAPASGSADGIAVSVLQAGRQLLARAGTAPQDIDLRVTLAKGEPLDVVVSGRGDPRGDLTGYRIRIFDEDRCRGR